LNSPIESQIIRIRTRPIKLIIKELRRKLQSK
jgi:hypothetical protein